MTVPAYALLWVTVISLACAADQVWMRFIRPRFERRYSWPPLQDSERIPAHAWAGGLGAVVIIFIVLPTVGVAAGY